MSGFEELGVSPLLHTYAVVLSSSSVHNFHRVLGWFTAEGEVASKIQLL